MEENKNLNPNTPNTPNNNQGGTNVQGNTSVVGGENKSPVKQAKKHPLGELVKVKCHSRSLTDKRSQIFVSINQFNFEIQQDREVMLPKGVVKFLQSSTKIVHVVEDGKAISKNESLYDVTVIL